MFDVLIKLKWFFRKYWKQYTMAILLLIFTSILEVIPPMFIGEAIDSITSNSMTSSKLWGILIPFFIIIIANYVLSLIWQYQLFGGAITLEKTLRTRLMYHFLKMTPTFYEKHRTGDLMARATNDLNAVSLTAGYGIMTLIDSTIYLGAIIVAMGMFISWKLTILAMIPVPIMAFLIQYFGKIVHSRYSDAQSAFGKLNNRVLESVSGVRVVRAYVQEKKDEERFNKMSEEVYEKYMNVVKAEALFGPFTRLGTALCYCIALGYGALLINQNEMTLGGLVSFTVYLGLAVWPMMAIGELINVMQQGNASLDRVQETLRYKEDVENILGEKDVTPSSIGFSEFTFQYPLSHVKNLQRISVQLKKGETLGIVGKTGAGKTTFVKQLLREYPLGEGQFIVGDLDVGKIPKAQLLNWIGYVPQDQFLFSKTIEENILYGKENATKEELNEVVKLACLEKDIAILPNGLSTLVGEKGVSLSGGQKQRVAIARALIKNPEILILDDALSAVDAKTEAKIIENIRNVRKGKTTIITTHRLSAIQHADYIIVLDDGMIVEEGKHNELLHKNGWYKEQFVRQQLGEAAK